jgi:hypothetical protein
MKEIKLVKYSKDGKKFSVSLGNGTIFDFTSKRLTLKFLAETSRFLTGSLYEARSIYISVWNKFQLSWGYFQSNSELFLEGENCQDLLTRISKSFDLAVNRSHWENGNHFSFTHIFSVIQSQKEIIKALNKVFELKGTTHEIYECEAMYNRLINLECELKNYGQTNAIRLFRIETAIGILNENANHEPKIISISKAS